MKGGTLQLAKVPSFQAAHLPSTSIKECAREKPERGGDGCQRKCLGNDEVPETGGTTIEWAAHFDQLHPHKYSYAVRVMTGKE
ncbi:unnamed protein product [Sphagnum jensenii]